MEQRASERQALGSLSQLLRSGDDVGAAKFLLAIPPAYLRDRIFTGDTWLHLAARCGCLESCRQLISFGVDVNDIGSGVDDPQNSMTPLVEAAGSGSLKTVELLLAHGADVDGPVIATGTPLMVACINGPSEIVALLLDRGAEINRVHTNWNRTALDIAEVHGHADIAALLRKRGGLRLEGGPRDWTGVRGQPFIEHLEQKVGPVSPMALTQIVPGDLELNLRFAQVAPRRQFKFLFTVGLCVLDADLELAVCLPASWPLNQAAMHDPKLGWPVRVLLKLADVIAHGRACEPGDVIERDDEALRDLLWPDSVARLLVTPVDATGLDNMMFLVPLAATAKVGTVAQRMALQAKRQAAKWSALAVDP